MVFNLFRRKKQKEQQEMSQAPKAEQKPYPIKLPEELSSIKENKKVIEILKGIEDPELNVDIWSLGLIYDITLNENNAKITMTFTSPTCPYGPRIIWEMEDKLKNININPKIELVFNPPWQPTEELRDMLGM